MSDASHRQMVDAFMRAVPHDFETLRKICHPQYVQDYPQSGERFIGLDKLEESERNRPGGSPTVNVRRVVGSEDKYVATPMFTPLRITGTGDTYTVEGSGLYPDGSTWFTVSVLDFRDDKIAHVSTYFAEPFESPEWRQPYVSEIPAR